MVDDMKEPTKAELYEEEHHCFYKSPTVDTLCRKADYENVWNHIDGAMGRLFVEHEWLHRKSVR